MTGLLDRAREAAEELVQRHPDYLPGLVLRTAVCAESDIAAEGQRAAQAVLERNPDFTISDYLSRIHYKNPSRNEELAAALRKAGLPE